LARSVHTIFELQEQLQEVRSTDMNIKWIDLFPVSLHATLLHHLQWLQIGLL